MKYNSSYYEKVYSGFENSAFAEKWATGCRLAAGIPEQVKGRVLEFGAGLGQNLSVIEAAEKWAVDINATSKASCIAKGFRWSDSLDHVPDEYFDVILSRHSLEHVHSPFCTLVSLCRKAVLGGRLFLVVPYESMDIPQVINKQDEHSHLYSWSPMTIKNLLLEAGWHVNSIKIHNGMMFKRTLVLLRLGPKTFKATRKVVTCLMPLKSAEIIVECTRNVKSSLDA